MTHRLNRTVLAVCAAACLLSQSLSARADEGLVTRDTELPAEQRAALAQAIAEHHASSPQSFQAVRDVKGHRPEVYRQFRNPVPMVAPELRRLGRPALLPMLEALAFQAPERRGATDREWQALTVGMLEAVGVLRDARSAAVLQQAFRNARSPLVNRAAAEALGRLCTSDGFALLRRHATRDGAKRHAAMRGLGQCRQLRAAKLLSSLLDRSTNPEQAFVLAESLGMVGSSWAWAALGPLRHDEGLKVRAAAAAALVPALIRHRGKARAATRRGLTMVESPTTRALMQQHRHLADSATLAELERVVRRIERRRRRTR